MKTITFVRHAESSANAGGITMPHNAIPLSALGERQAQAMVQNLDIVPSRVLVSSMLRTQQTASHYCARFPMKPEIISALDEFSLIDPALIAGMDGGQRREFVKPYWETLDLSRRLGEDADTFLEFSDRVDTFLAGLPRLPDATVVFGHGIWFGLMLWKQLGYAVADDADALKFRRFQLGLPMPNCAVLRLITYDDANWSVKADLQIMHRILKVR
jgi:alpha-ribazole phosphatase